MAKHAEQRVSFDGASQILDIFLRPFRGHDGAVNLCRARRGLGTSRTG